MDLGVFAVSSSTEISSNGGVLFSHEGFSSIHRAAAENNVYKVRKYLITNSNINLVTKDKNRMTPLMVAAAYGSVEAFSELLTSGASLKKRNANGLTAIQCAASCHQTKIILCLCDVQLVAGRI